MQGLGWDSGYFVKLVYKRNFVPKFLSFQGEKFDQYWNKKLLQCPRLSEVTCRSVWRSAQRNAQNTRTCPPTSVNCFNRLSRCNHLKIKGVIKQANATSFYYLRFLGMVMLRPCEVILGGDDGAASGAASFDAPPPN
jgi:hypothetical protein